MGGLRVRALCVVVRAKATTGPNKGPQWQAVAVATVSYLIWVYSGLRGSRLACPPGPYCWYDETMAPLLVLVWTFVVPLFYHGD